MTRSWVTTSSTTLEAMVNPLNAACDRGFVPDRLYFLKNPGVEAEVDEAISIAETIIEAYNDDDPDVSITELEDELEFDKIRTHVQSAIEASDDGDEVAVDFTPGRKFMSAIAFAAGMRYGADHVYYFYVSSPEYLGRLYPEIPRTAVDLFDFTEVV